MKLYHGGIAGLSVGDTLVPSPPHVTDGCAICVARAQGRTVTVGEYREIAKGYGERGRQILELLEGAPDDAPIDQPTLERAVYLTTSLEYATFYAARSKGDLYEVEAIGPMTPSEEDLFPAWKAGSARVARVLRRGVRLDRRERRHLLRLWAKAERQKPAMALGLRPEGEE